MERAKNAVVIARQPSTVEPDRVYRQPGRPDPRDMWGGSAAVVVIYVFAGFVVYWLRTGSWTVGIGGEVSTLGALIWFGPLLAWGAVFALGPRGALARFWYPLATVSVDAVGIRWEVDGQVGDVAWDDLGSVGNRLSSRRATDCQVRGRDGTALGRIPARVVGGDGQRHLLVDLVIAAQPDVFAPRRGFLTLSAVRRSTDGLG